MPASRPAASLNVPFRAILEFPCKCISVENSFSCSSFSSSRFQSHKIVAGKSGSLKVRKPLNREEHETSELVRQVFFGKLLASIGKG